MRNHFLFSFLSILSIIFTVYIIMDTLIIEEVYEKVEVNNNDSILINSGIYTANSYTDENINITIKEYYYNNTSVYVADVTLTSSDYLKTAFAKSAYGKNVTDYTSSIAESVNAILAINGDFYGVQENGYVLKNGVVYRNTARANQEDLVIYKDGSWQVINESDVNISDLVNAGAYNILSFGPALIKDSNVVVSTNAEVGKSMASNPRSAVGKISDNHYVFVVSDGRTSSSTGLSLYEIAEFMKNLGCDVAYNLDGGGSSTIVFNGTVINNPTTNGNKISERKVSDIVYIGY